MCENRKTVKNDATAQSGKGHSERKERKRERENAFEAEEVMDDAVMRIG